MEERRLYAIIGAGAALVVLIALVDVVAGDGNGDGDGARGAAATSTSGAAARVTTTTTAPPATTTTLPKAVQDRLAQTQARTALTTMKVVYADDGRYAADPVRLRAIEPSLDYVRGIATASSVVGAAYVETDGDGQVACASVRSASGELFLVKDVARGAATGMWYARGATLPFDCDGEALAPGW